MATNRAFTLLIVLSSGMILFALGIAVAASTMFLRTALVRSRRKFARSRAWPESTAATAAG